MNKYIPFLLLGLLLVTSCSRGFVSFKKGLVVDSFDFQYFSAKAKIRYNDGVKDLGGTANIRVQKDSAIWISLSPGLGVEVARIFISKDSINFLDRINKAYLQLSFDQLSSEYNFDINYHLIESIIIGNLIFPYKRENLVQSDEGVAYEQAFDHFVFSNVIGIESRKLEKLKVTDLETNSTISVNYGDFEEVGNEIFPFRIEATIENFTGTKQATSVSIGFNRAEIGTNQLKFPFDVPSKYKIL